MGADIGLIGLAVMGQNLALNMNDKGFKVAVFNRTVAKVEEFLSSGAKGTHIIGAHTLEEFIQTIKKPRKILLMVKAGKPVDDFIALLIPHLEKGDIIIDGGNSLFTDTNRRVEDLKNKNLIFIGAGVSGGEEGARHGPSIMPGGNRAGWESIKPIFQAIAAKVGPENTPCCEWVGEGGAGHYVKMVHNGIEYGDMQLISESYHILKQALHLTNQQLGEIFEDWNKGSLDSYLIEVTSQIFKFKEPHHQEAYLLDHILDVAGQKGTGKWAVNNALDLGVPLTLISEAVFARCLSSLKEERVAAAKIFKKEPIYYQGDKEELIKSIADGLYASKIISYAQGFMLMRQAALEYNWHLNLGEIALMWRGGCIIRSQFLGKIKEAYEANPLLKNLFLDPFFQQVLTQAEKGWRKTVAEAAYLGIYTPCFSTALTFFDGYHSQKLPANLIQAQRDYFGAHTYERVDQPRGKFFHTDWTGTGGDVSSTTYNV